MDENGNTDGLNLSGIVIALLLLSAIVFQEDTLTGSRPDFTKLSLHPNTKLQQVPARPWEDPLQAVSRFRNNLLEEQIRSIGAKQRPTPPTPAATSETSTAISPYIGSQLDVTDNFHGENRLKALFDTLSDQGVKRLTLLPYILHGGGYAEERESRLRSRQALVAAMARSQFFPMDGKRIAYWYREEKFSDQNLPNVTGRPVIIPWEVFIGNDARNNEAVLVLWLDGDNLDENPLRRLGRYFGILGGLVPEKRFDTVNKRIMGPSTSGMLSEMIEEACAYYGEGGERRRENTLTDQQQGYYQELQDSVMLSSRATAPPRWLPGCIQNPPHAAHPTQAAIVKLFDSGPVGIKAADAAPPLHIKFLPGIADDRQTLAEVVGELTKRNVRPFCVGDAGWLFEIVLPCGNEDRSFRHHIAVISEVDTLYGRTLPRVLCEEFANNAKNHENPDCASPDPGSVLHRFGYLRGLDGEMPALATNKDKAKQETTDKTAGLLENTEYLEPAHGPAQFDFLRRLSLSIRALDK